MPQQHSQSYRTQEQRFNDRFPLPIVAILAIIQMLTTLAIIALEIGHIVINIRITNLFVGLWASIPFTILWISMFAAICCCRRRSCATHAVAQNCISFIFACILIGINIAFLQRPDKCFFTRGICENLSWASDISLPFKCSFDNSSTGCRNTRLAFIKAQLAAGFIIVITNLLYLILYNAVASRASRADQYQTRTPANAVMAPIQQQSLPPTINYQYQPYANPPHSFQPSAPVLIPPYQPVQPQTASSNTNGNYLPPNQYPTLYPQIPNDRF